MRPTTDAADTSARAARPGRPGAPRRRATLPRRHARRRRRSRATVAGASPESTLSSTSCSTKKATVSRALRAQPLGEHDQPGTAEAGRRAVLAGRRRRAARGAARARATRRPLAASAAARAASPRQRRSAPARRARSAPSPRSSALQRRRDENGTVARGVLGRGVGYAVGDRVQRRVARGARPRTGERARRASSSSPSGAGTSLDDPQAAPRSACRSCRVQRTSTEASDSIAFSCWASTPRRAIAKRGDGEREAASAGSAPRGRGSRPAATAVEAASLRGVSRCQSA